MLVYWGPELFYDLERALSVRDRWELLVVFLLELFVRLQK